MAQVSRKLIVGKPITLPDDVNEDLIFDIDVALAEEYCKNKEYEKGFEIYERLVRKSYGDIELKNSYMRQMKTYADSLLKEKKYSKALELYKKLLRQNVTDPYIFKNTAVCLNSMGQPVRALRFFEKYEENAYDKEEVYKYLADIYYENIKDYEKAIEYYEKMIEKYGDNAHIYNMLGHLYSTYYQDKYMDRQIYYLKKAAELEPNNRVITKNIAYVLGKFRQYDEADKYYARLQQLNPTHSDLHSYGGYLVSKRDFANGFKFLMHRFSKEDLQEGAFPKIFLNKKVRWNEKMDLTGKHVVLHFEQGFGDSIMFIRFLDQLKAMCDKVSIVVQRPLLELFAGSDLGCDIYPDDIPMGLKYDVVIPMMDLPLVCHTTADTIPNAEGYLKVDQKYIDEFRERFIHKNDKFKIGIAYEGSIMGKETDRDIPLKFMYPLMELPGVEIYSFQVSDPSHQMDRVPSNLQFIRLGDKLRNFRDTAAGLKCMDMFISSDNGVMNLAGALAIPSICLFNTISEWRWIDTKGDDVVWYKSVKPIQASTSRAWDETINKAVEIIQQRQLDKLNNKLKLSVPKGSIKSKNISPNAAISLDAVAGLLDEEEKEKAKKAAAKKKATKKTTAKTIEKKTSAKKTTEKKAITKKNASTSTTAKKSSASKTTKKSSSKPKTTRTKKKTDE